MPASHAFKQANELPHANDEDVYLFREGTLANLHACWVPFFRNGPGAALPSGRPTRPRIGDGDWNGWIPTRHPLSPRHDGSGIWEGALTGSAWTGY